MNQYIEYRESSYTINDSIFGSGFYVGTGLHAIHITIGTIFIFIGLLRVYKSDMTNNHHIGLETGILY
jgi:cytochrome c oxidase subunit 3